MDQARRTLEAAVAERRACRLARPGGGWLPGILCRLEASGVVVNVPGSGLRGGEEVRIWLEGEGRPLHFEATVLRAGVPVPDRGPNGILVGFLSETSAPAPDPAPVVRPADPPVLEVRVGTGAPVSLLAPPVVVVDVAADRVDFQVPRSFVVKFPENGLLRLRIGATTSDTTEATGRVGVVVAGEGHVLYRVVIEEVERQDLHQRAVPVLRAALGQ